MAPRGVGLVPPRCALVGVALRGRHRSQARLFARLRPPSITPSTETRICKNGWRRRMAKPWEELHTQISTEEEYTKSIAYKGLTCMEVHAGWCGPSTAAIPTLKKLHWDMVEERSNAVQFVIANSDKIPAFEEFKDRSKPLFIMYRKGAKLSVVEGVNTYALKQFIEENAPSQADVNADAD